MVNLKNLALAAKQKDTKQNAVVLKNRINTKIQCFEKCLKSQFDDVEGR